MPNKLTDLEIVTTLNDADGMEHIAIYCADGKGNDMKPIPMVDIIYLINRLQDKNKNLEERNVILRGTLDRLQAENERLEKELETEKNQVIRLENQIGRLLSMNQAKLDTIHDLQEENNWYNETLNTIKAEAYKEFAERLKTIMYENYQKFDEQPYPIATISIINNLLKELVGDNNA